MFAILIGSSTVVGGPIFVAANRTTMNLLNGMVRKLVGACTGRTFAKGNGMASNGTTTYTFSGGRSNNKSGKGLKLQPVTVKAK